MPKIDMKKLRAAIHDTVATLQELKKRQRESHQPRWNRGHDDWALAKAKTRATILCSIRAEMRGRLHRQATTHEQQLVLIQATLNSFAREIAVTAAA